MKTSYYCIPIKADGHVILFDSLSEAYIRIGENRFTEIYHDGAFIQNHLTEPERILLEKHGFLVEDEMNQRAFVLENRQLQRLDKTQYQIIINPTLDCNLSCWYCYESHVKGSRLSVKLIEAIQNHIKLKYLEDNFQRLDISFFGGEPLLATKQVLTILAFVETFCKENDIALHVHFTSNGTILPTRLLEQLKNVKCSFQITLDGDQTKHDSVRFQKGTKRGTYSTITRNIRRILDTIETASITIRINYDEKTLEQTHNPFHILQELDPTRVSVSLHQVWQVDQNDIDEENLLQVACKVKDMGYKVNIQGYPVSSGVCYADYLNSCVVNYNGDVFKCTARDFSSESGCGKLQNDGLIFWDYGKVQAHCFSGTPTMCKNCKLLPICPSICSQRIIEHKGKNPCILRDTTHEEIALLRYLLQQEHQ